VELISKITSISISGCRLVRVFLLVVVAVYVVIAIPYSEAVRLCAAGRMFGIKTPNLHRCLDQLFFQQKVFRIICAGTSDGRSPKK